MPEYNVVMMVVCYVAAPFVVWKAQRWPELPVAVGTFGIPLIQAAFGGCGISVTAISCVLLSLGLIRAFVKSRRVRFGGIERSMMALALVVVASLLYTPSAAYGQRKALLFAGWSVLIVVSTSQTVLDRRSLSRFVWQGTLLTIAFTGLCVVFQSEFIKGDYSRQALLDPTGDSLTFGCGMVLALVWLNGQGIALKALAAVIAATQAYFLLLSGSRSSMAAILVSLLLVSGLRAWKGTRSLLRSLKYPLFAAFLVLGGVLIRPMLPPSLIDRVFIWERVTDSGRQPHYAAALALMTERPFIGLGVGGYKAGMTSAGYYSATGGPWDQVAYWPLHPHNIFLEVFVEYGALGAAVFAFLLWRVAKGLYAIVVQTQGREKSLALGMVATGLFTFGFVISQFEFDMPGNTSLWMGVGLVAALTRLRYSRQVLHTPVALLPQRALPIPTPSIVRY